LKVFLLSIHREEFVTRLSFEWHPVFVCSATIASQPASHHSVLHTIFNPESSYSFVVAYLFEFFIIFPTTLKKRCGDDDDGCIHMKKNNGRVILL
jgi:hypothetical protein